MNTPSPRGREGDRLAKLKQCSEKGCEAKFKLKRRYLAHLRNEHGQIPKWTRPK